MRGKPVRRAVAVTVLLLAAAAAIGGAGEAGEPVRPTVLLITIDTIRADRLGCYGYDRATTPVIDRLAREGLLVQEALTTVPLTTPSHATILTGLHPRSHAVLGNAWQLDPSCRTLAQRFHAAGYRTAAFVSAVVLDPRCGLDAGFDHYGALVRPGPMTELTTPGSAGEAGTARGRDRADRLAGRQRRGVETVDEALAWLEAQKGEAPLFVWVHFYDPHQPFDPLPPWRQLFGRERGERNLSTVLRMDMPGHEFGETDDRVRREIEARRQRHEARGSRPARSIVATGSLTDDERQRIDELYDGEVAATDFQVGRLLDWFQRRGLYRDAVVAVVGDHGETLGEHLDGYYGHHHVLFDSSLLVPLILRLPGRAGGTVAPSMAGTADVAPTLLRAAGLTAPAGLDGRDLLAGSPSRPMFCETYLGVRPGRIPAQFERNRFHVQRDFGIHAHAFRDGRWKLVLDGTADSSPQLFDLAADPGEQTDVADGHQALVRALTAQWQRWCEAHELPERSRKRRDESGDEALREKLRHLGYVE